MLIKKLLKTAVIVLFTATTSFVAAQSIKNCPKQEYPTRSRREEEEGVVRLVFAVDVQGQLIAAEVEKSSGFQLLDNAALELIKKCTFNSKVNGQIPIDGKSYINITYKLSDENPESSEKSRRINQNPNVALAEANYEVTKK